MTNQQPITHINLAKGFRGGERQTLLLISQLSKQGYLQQLVTRKDSDLAEKAKTVKNLKIIQIGKPYFLHLKKIKNSRLLHAHETKAAQLCLLMFLRYQIPYIVTRRVDHPIKHNLFNKKIYEKAQYTIALSSVIQQKVAQLSKRIHSVVIPSAYGRLETNTTNIEKLRQRFKNQFIIGHIGELCNKHKGQYYLIQAAKKLQVTHPQIHFILLGQGPDAMFYRQQAQGLTNITFEGFVDNVGDYIAIFDLFVFPSLYEGLGSSLLDVMQAKVPIIASSVGGIVDIVHHEFNGLLVPSKDAEAIQQAIIRYYEKPKLRLQMAQTGYHMMQYYAPDYIASRYIELYEQINKQDDSYNRRRDND